MKKLLALLVVLSLMVMAVPALAAGGAIAQPITTVGGEGNATITPTVSIADAVVNVSITWAEDAPTFKYVYNQTHAELYLKKGWTEGNDYTITFKAKNETKPGMNGAAFWDGTVTVTGSAATVGTTAGTATHHAMTGTWSGSGYNNGVEVPVYASSSENIKDLAVLTYSEAGETDGSGLESVSGDGSTNKTAAANALKGTITFTVAAKTGT